MTFWSNIFALFGRLSFKLGKLHYFEAPFPAVLMVRIFANCSLSSVETINGRVSLRAGSLVWIWGKLFCRQSQKCSLNSHKWAWLQAMEEFTFNLPLCFPRFTDTNLIWTPRYYYGQFSLSLEKALTFSLNSTRLIRTQVNADNGHLFLAQSTNSHRKPTLLMRTRHYQPLGIRPFFLEGKEPSVASMSMFPALQYIR